MSDELDPLDDFDDFDDFDDDLDLTLYADQPELLQEVTTQVIEVVETGLRINGVFHLALTGGTLGSDLTRALVDHWNANPEMYQGLHIWWSDERFVERSSSEQNSAPAWNSVTNQNVVIHTLRASDEVANIEVAVDDYLAQLGENFMDLTILGLGPDGHVASLFPGAAHIDRLEKVIAITDSPKPPAIRATFTMSMINTSTLIWIIAAGASKAEAVTKIIEGDLSIPASYVRAADHTRLIVDTDAFFTE
jgi:6-phosphogluconolactonase